MRLTGRLGLLTLLTLVIPCPGADLAIRVMSVNVRYPNPGDGADVWEARRDFLAETIRKAAPDLIGTQELFRVQGEYLAQQLPEFSWFGISRRGNDQDEHMGVFFRRDRFEKVAEGQFWLSESPDVPGSQSWGTDLPRMVTWGRFRERASGQEFYLLNTHFAHRRTDEDARIRSAAVIRTRWAGFNPKLPVIVTGDFNAPAGGAVHAAMLGIGLRDTRAIAAEKAGPDGTVHGFSGRAGDRRIDWILASPEWETRRNETIDVSRSGRYPSDHFPVMVDVVLRQQPARR